MLDIYFKLLRKPGAKAFASAGLLSRLPISMFNISLILMVQIQYNSYEMAGRVAAISTVAWALQTVPTARWSDRVGQRAAMWPLTIVHLLGVSLAITTAMNHGSEAWLVLGAVLAAFSGPLGSLTRARWSYILKSDKDIHTAFSLEGALDEVLFIAGPALATILATVVYAPLGLVVSSAGMLIGMTILLPQRSTEPPARRDTGGTGLGWRIPPVVWAVALVAAALGLMFGAIDISTIAFAEELGAKDKAGLVLGVLALGSFFGGLVYGSREWKTPLRLRLVIGSTLVAVGFSTMTSMPNLVLFSVVGFFAGAVIAPTITSTDNIIQRAVKSDQLTEGMAWLRIGIGTGVAAGAWAAGYLIESTNARAGLTLAGGAAILVAVVAFAIFPILRTGIRDDVHEGADAPN